MGRYSSGQRGQTVNLLTMSSQVRILLSPHSWKISRSKHQIPNTGIENIVFWNLEFDILEFCMIAGVAQLVERQPSKLNVAGSNPVSRSKG